MEVFRISSFKDASERPAEHKEGQHDDHERHEVEEGADEDGAVQLVEHSVDLLAARSVAEVDLAAHVVLDDWRIDEVLEVKASLRATRHDSKVQLRDVDDDDEGDEVDNALLDGLAADEHDTVEGHGGVAGDDLEQAAGNRDTLIGEVLSLVVAEVEQFDTLSGDRRDLDMQGNGAGESCEEHVPVVVGAPNELTVVTEQVDSHAEDHEELNEEDEEHHVDTLS